MREVEQRIVRIEIEKCNAAVTRGWEGFPRTTSNRWASCWLCRGTGALPVPCSDTRVACVCAGGAS